MANRLRGVGSALAICFVSAPVAIVATITLLPLWSRIESTFAIESVGHSGPAQWCYLACYFITLACASFIWWAIRRRGHRSPGTQAGYGNCFPTTRLRLRVPKLNFFRAIAILLTQLPLLLFIGGQRDLLFGFNQTNAGIGSLLALFFFVPLLNLTWLVTEVRRSIRLGKDRVRMVLLLMPCVALLFIIESIAIDLYLSGLGRFNKQKELPVVHRSRYAL